MDRLATGTNHRTIPRIEKQEGGEDAMKWLGRAMTLLVVLAVLFAGGYWFVFLKPTPIEHIQMNADQYDGQEVLIYGEVSSAFSMFGVGGYTVKGSTGEIYIFTTQHAPQEGHWVTVRGTVKKAMNLGKKAVVGLKETEKYNGRYWGF
jgi:hypothetical protein